MLSLPVVQQGNYPARRMALDIDARQKIKEAFPFEAFKQAALTLLDCLTKDSAQPQRKDDWLRVAAIVEDISEQRAACMADVLVAAVPPQYPVKLAFLAAADVEDRLRRATEHIIK
ncbi:hypothetical protein BDR05DRAFT_1006024 [Suillus weaverae]|nr:hypothetical protein BDR05DRAFT_1006024 [Suillus weaverae]